MDFPFFINKRIFWDTDITSMNMQVHKDFIITKVFEWGNLKELKALMSYYSTLEIIHALTIQPYLSKVTLSFASVILNIPKEKFQCYTNKQLHAWPL